MEQEPRIKITRKDGTEEYISLPPKNIDEMLRKKQEEEFKTAKELLIGLSEVEKEKSLQE